MHKWQDTPDSEYRFPDMQISRNAFRKTIVPHYSWTATEVKFQEWENAPGPMIGDMVKHTVLGKYETCYLLGLVII
jgi:hypothetical protein